MNLSGPAKNNIKNMVEALQPTKDQLESIRQSAVSSGQKVPDGVNEALTNIEMLSAIAGNTDAIHFMIGQHLSTDPKFQETLSKAKAAGLEIDAQFQNGLNAGNVDFVKCGSTCGSQFASGFSSAIKKGYYPQPTLNIDFSKVKVSKGYYPQPVGNIKWNAQGVVFDKPTIAGVSGGTLQGFGEAGREVGMPLNEKVYSEIARGILNQLNPSVILSPPERRDTSAQEAKLPAEAPFQIIIEKFINNRPQDVQAFGKELEFYSRNDAKAKGG
jgi:hypothetical protein